MLSKIRKRTCVSKHQADLRWVYSSYIGNCKYSNLRDIRRQMTMVNVELTRKTKIAPMKSSLIAIHLQVC